MIAHDPLLGPGWVVISASGSYRRASWRDSILAALEGRSFPTDTTVNNSRLRSIVETQTASPPSSSLSLKLSGSGLFYGLPTPQRYSQCQRRTERCSQAVPSHASCRGLSPTLSKNRANHETPELGTHPRRIDETPQRIGCERLRGPERSETYTPESRSVRPRQTAPPYV